MAYMRATDASIHKAFASSLPNNIRLMFAYGSGVFKQLGHDDINTQANMLDYIIVTDDAVQWHSENLTRNWRHYSFLKYGGAKFMTEIQRGFGAQVYFNTLVPFENRLVKYGVIETKDLKDDIKTWKTLYISGRLHKPVLLVVDNEESENKICLESNLRSAVQTSLLLLPDSFTDEELFLTLAQLSYAGDPRMIIGEDKNKIKNIVLPHLDKFHELYKPIVRDLPVVDASANFRTFSQDGSPAARHTLLTSLPANVRDKVILGRRFRGNRNKDVSIILRDIAHSPDCSARVSKACRDIVRYSSFWQSVKGLFTAGVRKAVVYSAAKMHKMIKSLLP